MKTVTPKAPRAPGLFPSPDGRHIAELEYESEIRFGPPFFGLLVNGRRVLAVEGTRVWRRRFGDPIEWSRDSRFLATQEWLSLERPRTRVLLFDLEAEACAPLAVAEGGFVKDFRFVKNGFSYSKVYYGDGGRVVECGLEWHQLPRWERRRDFAVDVWSFVAPEPADEG